MVHRTTFPIPLGALLALVALPLAAPGAQAASRALPAQSPQVAEQQPIPGRACDARAIPWVLPADFDQALERARREQRLLLIKGVSFGIDELGATCASKGRW